MLSLSPRRVLSACALTAAMAAFAVPGAANAFPGTQCSGESILGKGSSAQKLAHINTWGPEFHKSAFSLACNGTQGSGGTPTVVYETAGSGAGMELWGLQGHPVETGTYSFVGTDEPPNQAQKTEIENAVHSVIYTEPVTQFAEAIVVHLPEGCTATSEARKKHPEGRLVLSNNSLEKIFAGELTKWSQLTEGGNKLVGASCNANEEIQRVVRLDESGTTHVFKRYLNLISEAKLETEEGHGKHTWGELSESLLNQVWPSGSLPVVRPAGEGGGKLVEKVQNLPSSIGYAAVSDARANKNFDGSVSGGPGTNKFWVELQNNGTGSEKGKYQDPASNGDVPAEGNSNCEKVKYTNGHGKKFPPKHTTEPWNEVTTATKVSKYALCGLTYDLLMKEYSKAPGTKEGQAQTVHDYFTFVYSEAPGGGQALIQNKDFLPLPSKLVKESKEGLANVKF